MKYYKLGFSRDRKITGVMPQSQEGYLGDIQQDFLSNEGSIDIEFKLPEPIFEEKAKQTSYIKAVAIPPRFLVIDDELLTFLKSNKIGKHQEWKIKTWYKKQLIDRYNLFILNDTKQSEYIDFANSEFYIGTYSDFTYQGESVQVNDYSEYLNKRKELSDKKLWLREKKVVINLRNTQEDMFRIANAPNGGYYISEKLKNAIEENKFTGMSFKEVIDLKKVEVLY